MEIIDGKDLVNMKFIKTEDGLLKEYKPQGRFIPNFNQVYYYINPLGGINETFKDTYDDYLINHNLVFRTRKECEDYKWFLEQLDKYKTDFSKEEWEDQAVQKYHLYYDYGVKYFSLKDTMYFREDGSHFFTLENIIKFVDTVGEDRIKRYMFDIRE